ERRGGVQELQLGRRMPGPPVGYSPASGGSGGSGRAIRPGRGRLVRVSSGSQPSGTTRSPLPSPPQLHVQLAGRTAPQRWHVQVPSCSVVSATLSSGSLHPRLPRVAAATTGRRFGRIFVSTVPGGRYPM